MCVSVCVCLCVCVCVDVFHMCVCAPMHVDVKCVQWSNVHVGGTFSSEIVCLLVCYKKKVVVVSLVI